MTGWRTCTSRTAPGRRATSTWYPAAALSRVREVLESLARTGFSGHVVVEVSTRRVPTHEDRESDLAEALAFARLNLASAVADHRP